MIDSDSKTSVLLHEEPRLNEEWGKGNVHIPRLRTYTTLPSTVLYRETRHEFSSSPSTRDETEAEERGNFPKIERVLGGKWSSHWKVLLALRIMLILPPLFFPTEESYYITASPAQQRTLNLEFREAGGRGDKQSFKSLVCIYNVVEKLHFRMEWLLIS